MSSIQSMKLSSKKWLRVFLVCALFGLTCGVATLFKIMNSDHDEMVLIFAMIAGSLLFTVVGIGGLVVTAIVARKNRVMPKP